MRLGRYLQYWLSGTGAPLHVADFVPKMHPMRQWADTFPWAALVSAIEQSFDTRFPRPSPRGRRPVPIRVLFALELLKHELGASDEAWHAHILSSLHGLNGGGRRGFAFNCLTRYSDAALMRPHLFYADPCELFDYCKTRFSRDVALLHDYGLWEFTIAVRR